MIWLGSKYVIGMGKVQQLKCVNGISMVYGQVISINQYLRSLLSIIFSNLVFNRYMVQAVIREPIHCAYPNSTALADSIHLDLILR